MDDKIRFDGDQALEAPPRRSWRRRLVVGTMSVLTAAAVGAMFWPAGGVSGPASAEAFPGPASIARVVAKAVQEKQSEAQKSRDSLHGAAPGFAAQPTPKRKPATAKKKAVVSSVPSSAAPARRAALTVAREFGEAFVVYETGGEKKTVKAGFDATSTRQLSRALLRRPPRQPAAVKVPKAKVVNVVAGPSKDGVYPVSVSLLRVGVTSELRLELQRGVGKKWQVTDVLG